MKIRITFILLLIPFFICAQTKKQKPAPKHKHTHKHIHWHKVKKEPYWKYYESFCLMPDSAVSPYLYSQVYEWIGTPYKYAGRTKKGIDCSDFVNEMYKNIYCINLSGGAGDIWKAVKPIEKVDLQEGDILFFKIKKGQISHVGIYLGNNKFAHASVQTGVTINDLDEAYYKKFFYKGGRVR